MSEQVLPTARIACRAGGRPSTTSATPHFQLDQFAPAPLQAELWRRMAALPDVRVGKSLISIPSSRALHINEGAVRGPKDAYLVGTEFAHLHGDGSGSLHLTLPLPIVTQVLAADWGEQHPAVALGMAPPTLIMLFSPRDETELELVWDLVRTSHAYARGEMATASA